MKRRSLALVLAAALVISLAGCSQETEATEGTAAGTQAEQTEATQEVTEAVGGYTAGTYTGTATGMNGEVTVEVVFDDTRDLIRLPWRLCLSRCWRDRR